jgi:hypothetical protein
MVAMWYFWHRADPDLDPDMVEEIMGEYDGWENCFLPHPSVMDVRREILNRWPDLADEVHPMDPSEYARGFEDPDAPADLLERVLVVLLFEGRLECEGEIVQIAKERGLSCIEQNTGRTTADCPRSGTYAEPLSTDDIGLDTPPQVSRTGQLIKSAPPRSREPLIRPATTRRTCV